MQAGILPTICFTILAYYVDICIYKKAIKALIGVLRHPILENLLR